MIIGILFLATNFYLFKMGFQLQAWLRECGNIRTRCGDIFIAVNFTLLIGHSLKDFIAPIVSVMIVTSDYTCPTNLQYFFAIQRVWDTLVWPGC